MINFAITTSTKYLILTLFENEEKISEIKFKTKNTHSKNIVEQIEKLFLWSNITIFDIDNVLISVGPGSFTGIRVSMAIIKSLFLETKANIYEVNELMVYNYKSKDILTDYIFSVVDGQKEKVYYNFLEKRTGKLIEEGVGNIFEILEKITTKIKDEKMLLIGDAINRHRSKLELINNNFIFLNDEFNNIDTIVYNRMYFDNLLKKTTLEEIKPNYMEKIEIKKINN